MILSDLIVGGAILAPTIPILVSKAIKTKIPEDVAINIEKNGLYHATKEENISKILESGYFKTSNHIMSYGKRACFMFNGVPDVKNYIKNMGLIDDFINGDKTIIHTVKLNLPRETVQNHYQMRPFNDGAIMFEGECFFDERQAKYVQLALDVKLLENGKKELYFKERTEEEIKNNPKGIMSEDVVKLLNEYKNENQHSKFRMVNSVIGVFNGIKSEFEYMKNGIKSVIDSRKMKLIEESPKQKFDRLMENGILAKKTPVHSQEYIQNKFYLQNRGLKSIYVKEALENIDFDKNPNLLKKINDLSAKDKHKALLTMALVYSGKMEDLKNEKNVGLIIDSVINKKENEQQNKRDSKIIDVISKSGSEAELDRNIKDFDDETRDLIQKMYAVNQDINTLCNKKLVTKKLNLDVSKQLVDCSFQLKELVEYLPNIEVALQKEERRPTVRSFIEDLRREQKENDVSNVKRNRARMIEKARKNMNPKDKEQDEKIEI